MKLFSEKPKPFGSLTIFFRKTADLMTEVKKKSDFVTLWLPIHDTMARFACIERMRESPSMINAAGQYPTASIQALIPVTPECRKVLDMAKTLPGNSEYIFHNKKGKPIQRDSYIQNLGRRCKRLNIDCTHNHAFRVAFNSRLIKLGFSSADRALILGHEVQTNESHYSVTDKRHLADLHKKLTGEEAHTGNKNTKNSVVKEEQ